LICGPAFLDVTIKLKTLGTAEERAESPEEIVMGDWSASRPARCQTLFSRGRQQRAFRRSSEDSVEIVYHVGLIGRAASIGLSAQADP
jgi:hypothetical protein